MQRLIYILSLVFLFSFTDVVGQTNNLRTKKIVFVSDTLTIDSLNILPNSVVLKSMDGRLISVSAYEFNFEKSCLIRKDKSLVDTLTLSYRVFDFNISKNYYHKDINQLQKSNAILNNPFIISYNNSNTNGSNSIFQNDGLVKNGSVSRGISFGNNQDVVINSNLNLQVSGKLTPEIEIALAATDNNIPIQPDGNTQQLQEFDKVYIQLNDNSTKLIMGDFQLNRPNSYFMNFYKRTQGLFVNNIYKDSLNAKEKFELSSTASAAVSRGRFARNVIQGIENNQGPYRLRGADGELFIIMLSGTEKVYIDGKLLTRGQENEYVVDYNTSEITFTAKQIITKDKRITVEFQYSERNYARSLFYVSEEFKTDKIKLGFNFYQEQDNKNKSLLQSLSGEDKLKLSLIGDTLSSASTSGASIADFNTTEVFYQKQDTIANSVLYKDIFIYSTNPDSINYRVKFSFVGDKKGNYNQIQSTANGKVFVWVEPIAGIPQGSYEPVILLVTPKQKKLLTSSLDYAINKNQNIRLEGAFSQNDINTFSKFDSKNDNSNAAKILYNGKVNFKTKNDSVNKNKINVLNYNVNYEYTQKNFTPIERFRSVEMDRDWNRPRDSVFNDQHIILSGLNYTLGTKVKSDYTFAHFKEGSSYSGFKQSTNQAFNLKKTNFHYVGSLLNSNNNAFGTIFYRHKATVSQNISKLKIMYNDEFENNRFNYTAKDSLLPRSYAFWDWEASASNADSTATSIKVFYRERTDKALKLNKLSNSAKAQNVGFSMNVNKWRNHYLKTTITYRKLNIIDSLITTAKADNTLLSRFEYSPRLFKGFIQSNIFYETGYGLEPKREYAFIEVNTGQGTHFWRDYNGNGIKELNEFEIAQYSDQAIYIKIYTPTNNYVKAGHNQFNFSLNIKPAVFKKSDAKGFAKLMARFATQTVYRMDNKRYNSTDLVFNPLELNLNDSNMVNVNSTFRQALFFNQSSQVCGFDYTFQDNKNKQLLTNGFETRYLQTHELRARYNINKAWTIFGTGIKGTKLSEAQLFSNRNYKIDYYETEAKLSFQPNTSFRISGLYKRSDKQNNYNFAADKAVLNNIGVELKYNKLSKGSLNLKADYIDISFNNSENTPVAFELLNALKPGRNITWNLLYQQNLNSNLQISFTYDGRKSEGNKMIHIGGAQIRAFF